MPHKRGAISEIETVSNGFSTTAKKDLKLKDLK
jgi:hypothetical protein